MANRDVQSFLAGFLSSVNQNLQIQQQRRERDLQRQSQLEDFEKRREIVDASRQKEVRAKKEADQQRIQQILETNPDFAETTTPEASALIGVKGVLDELSQFKDRKAFDERVQRKKDELIQNIKDRLPTLPEKQRAEIFRQISDVKFDTGGLGPIPRIVDKDISIEVANIINDRVEDVQERQARIAETTEKERIKTEGAEARLKVKQDLETKEANEMRPFVAEEMRKRGFSEDKIRRISAGKDLILKFADKFVRETGDTRALEKKLDRKIDERKQLRRQLTNTFNQQEVESLKAQVQSLDEEIDTLQNRIVDAPAGKREEQGKPAPKPKKVNFAKAKKILNSSLKFLATISSEEVDDAIKDIKTLLERGSITERQAQQLISQAEKKR